MLFIQQWHEEFSVVVDALWWAKWDSLYGILEKLISPDGWKHLWFPRYPWGTGKPELWSERVLSDALLDKGGKGKKGYS